MLTVYKEYIYKLTDPREQEDITATRYIGKTKYPQMRFASHLRTERDKNNPEKVAWILELSHLGLLPIMEIIEIVQTPGEVQAVHREKYWIQHYKEQGAKLLNITYAEDPKPCPYPIVFNITTHPATNPLLEENTRLRVEVETLRDENARLHTLLEQISSLTAGFTEI